MMQRDAKEERVAELLGGLERIEAPSGFEDRVMRRIAGSTIGERSRGPGILLALKFAVPAAVLLMMGVMFVFFGNGELDVASVPPVQDGQISPSQAEEMPPAKATAAAVGSPTTDQTSPTPSTSRPSSGSAPSRSGISSEDIAVHGPGETYTPPGIDLRSRDADPSTVSPGGSVDIRDVLSFIGISADCGQDGCRVTSLSNGSLADRAKVNVGDRIVSVDGRPISGSTAFGGPTSFKSFQVVRGGRTLILSLTSN